MKNLLALVMAVVMVLALAIPAFAANGGKIKVAEPGTHTYDVYKLFDATKTGTEYTYKCNDPALADLINDPTNGFHDLIIDPTTNEVTKTATYSAAEFANWLADLAEFDHDNDPSTDPIDKLAAYKVNTSGKIPGATMKTGYEVDDAGYYFITYDNGRPYALTTVYDADVQIQNKHDTPFDKDVYKADAERTDRDPSHNEKSVQMGDILYYQITGKVVDVEDNTQYNYLVWDKMSKGQKLNLTADPYKNTVKVYVQPIGDDGQPDPAKTKTDITDRFTVDTLNTTPVTSTPKDTIWVNTTVPANADAVVYTDTQPSFVVNIDMKGLNDYIKAPTADGGLADDNLNYAIIIEYNATVLEDVGVIVNTAHLVSNDLIKDAQTQNYVSEIVVDKFETGNASQKLAGAAFVLMNEAEDAYYYNNGTKVEFLSIAQIADKLSETSIAALTDPGISSITNVDTLLAYKEQLEGLDVSASSQAIQDEVAANLAVLNGVIKVTDTAGAAHFTGLKDGTYKLLEVKAPDGYVRLDTPVTVVVNGKAALDPKNTVDKDEATTEENQKVQLQNVSHVGNTPGSVLPSTGGRGTTMLYMAGLGMMLAAGAFLIFRRRAEAGK